MSRREARDVARAASRGARVASRDRRDGRAARAAVDAEPVAYRELIGARRPTRAAGDAEPVTYKELIGARRRRGAGSAADASNPSRNRSDIEGFDASTPSGQEVIRLRTLIGEFLRDAKPLEAVAEKELLERRTSAPEVVDAVKTKFRGLFDALDVDKSGDVTVIEWVKAVGDLKTELVSAARADTMHRGDAAAAAWIVLW